MARAVVVREIPKLPDDCNAWARSTKRAGGMFHAHTIGLTACRRLVLDRHRSAGANGLSDFNYWGVCPACYRLGGNS